MRWGNRRGVSIAMLVAMAALASASSAAADVTITVGPGCPISFAINAAETGTVTGTCPAGDTHGLNTIVVPAGTYAEHGLDVMSGRIDIVGHSASDTIVDAGSAARAFTIDSPATVTLKNLTIEHGLTQDGAAGASGSPFGGAGGTGDGGGGVLNNGTLTISDCVVTSNRTGAGGAGGAGTGSNAIAGDGGAGGPGGGVYNTGTLTVTGSRFTGNVTGNGGAGGVGTSISGGGGSGGRGGALANDGTVAIQSSIFTGNSTGTGGPGASGGLIGGDGGSGGSGAALDLAGASTIASSTIAGNTAGPGGAGVDIGGTGGGGAGVSSDSGATVHISNSSITGNSTGNGGAGGAFAGGGGSGGGVSTYGGLTLVASTIASNKTGTGQPGGDGGGMYVIPINAAPATISSSTIADNQSQSGSGNAIELIDGDMSVIASTVTSNTQTGVNVGGTGVTVLSSATFPAKLTEHDSIIAANGTKECSLDAHATLASLGNNISYPEATCAHEVQGNPALAPLASNGGPTQTAALSAGSAAIDKVPMSDSECAGGTDQRGVKRPVGAGCDIGAFEVTPMVQGTPVVSASPRSATIRAPLSVGAPTSVQLLYGTSPTALTRSSGTRTEAPGAPPTFTLKRLSPLKTYYYAFHASSPFGSLVSGIYHFSTAFKVVSVKEDRRNRIIVTLRVTGAGRAAVRSLTTITSRGRNHRKIRRKVSYGKAAKTARHAGPLRLTLTPSAAVLRALRSAHHLRVALSITFTPTGAGTGTTRASIRVRYHAKR
jgi:hypothetical protein